MLHCSQEVGGAALTRINDVTDGQFDLLSLQFHAEHLTKDTLSSDNACVYKPPVEEMAPAWESISACHDDHMEEDNSQGEIKALDSFLNDKCFRVYDEGDVQNVSYDSGISILFCCPIEC